MRIIPYAQRRIVAGFCLFALAVALLLLPTPQAPAQSYTFTTITVIGNQRIDRDTILFTAQIAPGQPLSAGDLNAAYQKILASGLFESVDVTPKGTELVISVVEYPTINLVNFEGNRRLSDSVLEQAIESQSRQVLNPKQVERDVQTIEDIYQQQGRIGARITPRIIRRSDNRADLVFEIFEGDLTEIERIGFVGNRAYSDNRLRRVLDTKQAGFLRRFIASDIFVADRIEFDKQLLQDFYNARGYIDFRVLDTSVELFRDRDGYVITFHVQEGLRFRLGAVSVVSEIEEADSEEFAQALRLDPGAYFAPADISGAITRLERLALIKGLDFVRAEPRITRNDAQLTVDVAFALVRSERLFVERIDIAGNTTTLDRVVRRQFRTAEGDPFNPREITEAEERIRALGFFSAVDVSTRQGTRADQVIIDVALVENPATGSLGLGATYSSNSGLGAVVRFREDNLLGRGQRLEVSFSTTTSSNDTLLRFTEPGLLGRDLELGLELSYRTRTYDQVRFDTNRGFFGPLLRFPVGENSHLQLSYAFSLSDYTIDSGDAQAGSLIDTEAAADSRTSNALGYVYTYDTRRGGLDPNAGYLFRFGQEIGGLGEDDYRFIKTTGQATAEAMVLNEEVTLRATLEAGVLNSLEGESFFNDRFALTSQTFRGFDVYGLGPRERKIDETDGSVSYNDPLGGNYYAVVRLEAEFPLGLPAEFGIRGGAFYDAGSVWGLDRTSPNVLYEDFTLRQSIGFSLLWDTPIGPLRFNFSRTLQKEEFDNDQSFNLSLRADF
ncbi:MAG: outer membrane protein assembly factor BamA [Rhodobacteraceae bacterium]|nr:outer membrane protein assembly factor BamA [Paracoccaceae bacterium]